MEDQTILLVEDNPDDEALALRALKKNRICNHVQVCRDGAEALDYLFCRESYSERNPDNLPRLIVLDLKLPKLDGIEVLRAVRADQRTRCIPVVVLTASKENRDLIYAYSLGANSCVRKQVDFNQFSDSIRRLGCYWLQINETPS